jgi:hypothetical protein
MATLGGNDVVQHESKCGGVTGRDQVARNTMLDGVGKTA